MLSLVEMKMSWWCLNVSLMCTFLGVDRVLLEVKVLETIDFNEHLHTFAVHKESGCNVLVWSFDLYDNRVYGIYKQPILRIDISKVYLLKCL